MHSIRVRLNILFLVVVTTTLAASGTYSYHQLQQALESRYQELQQGMLTRLQINLPAVLWDFDFAKALLIIDAEMLPQEVQGIRLTDAAGEQIGKIRDAAGQVVVMPEKALINGTPVETDLYYSPPSLAKNAATPGINIGRVTVYLDNDSIRQQLNTQLITKLTETLILDAVLLIALSLSLRMVLTPLSQLRDALYGLASNENEEVEELPENRLDEFGELVHGFNLIQRKLQSVIEHRRKAELEAVHAAREAARAYTDLKSAQDSLLQAEKLASLGGLVAGIAHEINTPVGITLTGATVLQAATEQVTQTMSAGAIKKSEIQNYLAIAGESVRLILSNTERAAHLIQSFKQIAADQTCEFRRTFNLHDYIDEIMLSLHPRLKKTLVRVDVDCPKDINLDGFPGALAQVLTNLTMNALTHAFQPEQPGRLRITARQQQDTITLHISDDGCGIAPADRSRIFDPFFTTRRGQGGTGLGLNIVYNIITKQFGGTIDLDAMDGKGTGFTIRFPRVAPQPETA